MKQHFKKDLMFFLSLKANSHLVLGKNNLRIILGLKSKNFKNIEARQKITYSYKTVLIHLCKKIVTDSFDHETGHQYQRQ